VDRGTLTNKAGRLLKHRAMEQAMWVMAIAKPSSKPPVRAGSPELWVGARRKKGEWSEANI
jgi:hypothetical protein